MPPTIATITAIMATKSAGGTAMAATMTAQPTETPLPTIPPNSEFCTPADLATFSLSSQSMGATGYIGLGAKLTNRSNAPCFLQAWPQVSLVDRQGKPLDVDYNYFLDTGSGDAAFAATEQALEGTTAKIGLWPGWSVWLDLIWSNWCGAPIAGGVVINLTLGNSAGTIRIPTDVQSGGSCFVSGSHSNIAISKLGYVTLPTP